MAVSQMRAGGAVADGPLARTLEVYRLEDGRWIVVSTHGGDETVRAAPFEVIDIHLERWWLESVEAPA